MTDSSSVTVVDTDLRDPTDGPGSGESHDTGQKGETVTGLLVVLLLMVLL